VAISLIEAPVRDARSTCSSRSVSGQSFSVSADAAMSGST
jgi:hypothetical protein